MILTPLIVSSAPLLRAVARGGWTSTRALAEAAGKKENNLNNDMRTLQRAGLVYWPDGAKCWQATLSEAGQAGLAALARAEGEGAEGSSPDAAGPDAAGLVALRHDQITPDPDNARRDVDTFDLNKLRLTILEHGLLQNLVVRPADPVTGLHRLVAGERRWRAIGLAIQFGEWPDDRPLTCRIAEADDLSLTLAALVENLSRADLHPLDEAAALERLVNAHGLSTQEVAERVGRSQRHVQDRLRLLGMDEGLKARMRLAETDPEHLTATAARKMLNTPRPARPVELTPKLGLALFELMLKAQRDPADLAEPGYTRIGDEAGGPLSTLRDRGFVTLRLEGFGPIGQRRAYARVMRNSSDAGRWLTEQGWTDGQDNEALHLRLCTAAGVTLPGRPDLYATAALNPDPVAEAAAAIEGSPPQSPVPDSAAAAASPPPLPRFSTGGNNVNDVRRRIEADKAERDELAGLALSPEIRLALYELAHKLQTRPAQGFAEPQVLTHEHWLDARMGQLARDGLARILSTPTGQYAVLTLKGRRKLDLERGGREGPIEDLELHRLRSAVGHPDWPAGGGYVTAFLADPPAAPAEAPCAATDDPGLPIARIDPSLTQAEIDQAFAGAQALADGAAAKAGVEQAWRILDGERSLHQAHGAPLQSDRIAQAARLTSCPLPWRLDEDGDLLDAAGQGVDLYCPAVTALIALAVNAAGGLATPAEDLAQPEEAE